MAHPYFHSHQPTHNPHSHPGILDVILVCSNTRRFESRYRLFKRCRDEMEKYPNTRVTVVELAYGDRPFYVAGPKDVCLRSDQELWHKENLINIGISRLPHDWKYVAWVDADITFLNKNWAMETVEALQHYDVVQPWSHAIDQGPSGETFATHDSFCSVYRSGKHCHPNYCKPYSFPHPGYAWAATRAAINCLGTLLDSCLMGASDSHMAWGFLGRTLETAHGGCHPNYKKLLLNWQTRAQSCIKKNLGYVPGTIVHHFHGSKANRQYQSRWDILVKHQFDPFNDILRDWQGLFQLKSDTPRLIDLRDAWRGYIIQRNEDDLGI